MDGATSSDTVHRFAYFNSVGTMFLNDIPLVRGAPAVLLLRILRAFLDRGQQLFFLQELRGGEKAGRIPNLEARLGRLERRLAERTVGFRLIRLRGCRRIEAIGKVELSEL